MRAHIVWAVAALIALWAFLGYRDRANRAHGHLEAQVAGQDSTIRYHRSHRDTIRDTVRVVVHDVRMRADTLRITDTIQVREFVERCRDLALACAGLDTIDTRLIDTILPGRIRTADKLLQVERRRRWLDRVGLCAGYGIQADAERRVTHGWQVGACVRFAP